MGTSISRGRKLEAGGYGFSGDDLPGLGDTPAESRFDPRVWFAEERRGLPFELEIGSGKGTFLVQQATGGGDADGTNFLGVEYAKQFWLYAADRVRRHALENVRMLCFDADVLVGWYLPDGLVRRVHVYFPDPWPKARHNKRRLIQEPFLRQVHRVLEDGGELRLVTDHADYWAWMNEHIDKVPELFERSEFDRPGSAGEGEVVGTNFERKYRREGRPFYAVTLGKK